MINYLMWYAQNAVNRRTRRALRAGRTALYHNLYRRSWDRYRTKHLPPNMPGLSGGDPVDNTVIINISHKRSAV